MIKKPFSIFEFLATGFYAGKAPKAPGTFGTLVGIPFAWAFSFFSPMVSLGLSFLLVLLSVFIADVYERQVGAHDLGEIVIDEISGFVVTMALIPFNGRSVLIGFLLFRFFDILKPPPIRQLDQRVKGGLGVVVDDIVAGIFANLLMQLIYTQTNWLGERLYL